MMRMMRSCARVFASLLVFGVPSLVFAQTTPKNFVEFAELILRFFRGVTSILLALTVLGLMYGVVLYFVNANDPQKREEIRPYLLWAVVGIAVTFGVWGFVELLSASLFGGGGIGLPFISPPAS
jgi:uncharacterized membrane protein YjfL (UPF0719 family)